MRLARLASGLLLVTFVASCGAAEGGKLEAAEIMRRVAENQDRLVKERSQFVYDEAIRVISRQANSKVMCEQTTRYTVTPKEKSSQRILVSTQGRYWRRGRFVAFKGDLSEDQTLDAGMVKSFRDDLTQTDSKDGLGKDLFPLTSEDQANLEFQLLGERCIAGRPAYVIQFRPKDHREIGWAGEATIDKEDFQPVLVYTGLSRCLPFFVRTMLGTDVPGLGFTTQYTRVADGVWFPKTFGTEFKIHAVFLFKRTVSISLENSNFRRAHVDSDVHYDAVPGTE